MKYTNYFLIALALIGLLPLSYAFEVVICAIFFCDLVTRLLYAENWKAEFKKPMIYIDIISCIPLFNLSSLKFLRFFRFKRAVGVNRHIAKVGKLIKRTI